MASLHLFVVACFFSLRHHYRCLLRHVYFGLCDLIGKVCHTTHAKCETHVPREQSSAFAVLHAEPRVVEETNQESLARLL